MFLEVLNVLWVRQVLELRVLVVVSVTPGQLVTITKAGAV